MTGTLRNPRAMIVGDAAAPIRPAASYPTTTLVRKSSPLSPCCSAIASAAGTTYELGCVPCANPPPPKSSRIVEWIITLCTKAASGAVTPWLLPIMVHGPVPYPVARAATSAAGCALPSMAFAIASSTVILLLASTSVSNG
jgi:hypothetical protein